MRRPPETAVSASSTARAALVLTCTLALLLTACTAKDGSPGPHSDTARRAATELAAGLAKKDVSSVEFAGTTSQEADDQLTALVAGMGPLSPTVTVDATDETGDTATATLGVSWTFPGITDPWTYTTSVALVDEAGRWKSRWAPTLVEPELSAATRLSQRRVAADRGDVLGADGAALVEKRSVVRIGIDKANVSGAAQTDSAKKLAKLVDIDADSYVKLVTDAGAEAFVEAITLRADDDNRPANSAVYAIKGALPIEDQQMLAPTSGFARPLLGSVGEASEEIVDASKGAVVGGDQVGLSGLQKRYDEQLRGKPGVEVNIVAAKASTASPSPSAAPSPSADPSPSAAPVEARTVHEVKPVPGKSLGLTLNLTQQQIAERILADVQPAAALVAIKPSTGEVLVAADGPGTQGQSAATVGQYPPGSTFKVASSLALLRAGLKPSSSVTCPRTVTVNGQSFKNYDDYPSSSLGDIDLLTAVAQSCNTAFIGQRSELEDGDLTKAAASLGVGTDYDVGFPSYFGSVPEPTSENGKAAAMIGQGTVLASPLAMASVAASVAQGRTVLPHLVVDSIPKSTAEPLTSAEAKQLRTMMGAVVSQGSGRFLQPLQPPAIIAKTGTAEFGKKKPPDTHAWMIAAQGDMAVAVFVAEGDSGSGVAGPLLKKFLDEVN